MKKELLEKKLKIFEKSGSRCYDNEDYMAFKIKLDNIYDKEVGGLRIRSKCDWYEKEKKYTKLFLTL